MFIIFFNIKLLHSQSPGKEEPYNRIADHEVVIESGPVEYEKNDERNPVVEEDDFDELGEEDEEPISAAHLMGHLYNTGKYGSRVLQSFVFQRRTISSQADHSTCSWFNIRLYETKRIYEGQGYE